MMQVHRFTGRRETPATSRGTVREGGGVSIPRGTCPECGAVYYGWALLHQPHQTCQHCGAGLDILTPSVQSTSDSERGTHEDDKSA